MNSETDVDKRRLIFRQHIIEAGLRPDSLPFPPIRPEWEKFPVIRTIRKVEKATGISLSEFPGGL